MAIKRSKSIRFKKVKKKGKDVYVLKDKYKKSKKRSNKRKSKK